MVSRAKLILIMEQHEISLDLAFLIDKFRYGEKSEKIEHVVSISRFACCYFQKCYVLLKTTFYVLDGKKHGTEVSNDFSGKIIIKRHFKYGLKHGKEIIYNPFNQEGILEVNYYYNGSLHGACYTFFGYEKNTKVKSINIFNNGHLIKSTENIDGVTVIKDGLKPLKWMRI